MRTPTEWVTSDQHFNHANIIQYENRPYASVEEMNEDMINKWNAVVYDFDTVYFLGDLAFNLSKEKIKHVLSRLKGHKIMIMGNHDKYISKSPEYWRSVGFEEVYPMPIIVKDFWILSHEPVYMNDNMPYCNLHGHSHSNEMKSKHYYNVCVEHTNYTPILFSDIIAEVTAR